MAATVADEVITVIAFPEILTREDSENEAQIRARWERILARDDLNPQQRLVAEKEYARFLGSRVDPAEGNGKLFVDAAAKAGENIINSAGAVVWKTVPGWVWFLAGLAAIAYFGFLFSPLLKAKGVIR